MSDVDFHLISSYCGLLSLAVGSIWAGSFASLPKGKRHPKGSKEAPEEDEDEEDTIERLTKEDAWLFPIIGSCVLLGLYLVLKYLGKEWINWLLSWYFSVMGVASVWNTSLALVRFVMAEKYKTIPQHHLVIRKGDKEGRGRLSLTFRIPSVLLLPISALPSFFFSFYSGKSALANNVLALSLCHNSLAMLRLDSFATGTILLSGLFVYDIWWVFGTNVMVSVATSLDLPIKLLWPKSASFSPERGFTMLGLGDVVIPGVFVALALRYDYHLFKMNGQSGLFKKHYFNAALMAYILGLVTTMTVMHTFKAAQPALLYLSPACISSFLVVAVGKGELKEAWSWSDTPTIAKEEGIEKEE